MKFEIKIKGESGTTVEQCDDVRVLKSGVLVLVREKRPVKKGTARGQLTPHMLFAPGEWRSAHIKENQQ